MSWRVCYPREAEGGSQGDREEEGEEAAPMKLSKARTGHSPTPRPSLESRCQRQATGVETTVMVLPLTSCGLVTQPL